MLHNYHVAQARWAELQIKSLIPGETIFVGQVTIES